MAIVTRCPACDTVFRVAPPQLQARNGMVRCGRCLTIFDGFKTLTTVPEPVANESPASAGAVPGSAAPELAAPVAGTPGALPPAESDREPPAPEAAPLPVPAQDERTSALSSEPAFKLEAVSATELAAAAATSAVPLSRSDDAEETRDFGPAPEQLTLEDHLFLEETREARARVARLWAGAAALAFLVLLAQLVYVYRGDIAAHYPSARPQLTRWCEMLGCAIYLPQRPQLIVIEASDLQATDPARPAVIQLTATVRNHATYDLGFPALDLVLTNSRDHTLARRIIHPADYLEAGRNTLDGIPAKGEMTINLDLDTADLRPAGFRLDLMAPSPP